MTISSTTRTAGPYAGTGLVTTYPFAFKVFATSDVFVVRTVSGVDTTLTLGSDYTVTLNANQDSSPGGNVVLFSVLAVGATLNIRSSVLALQLTDITNAGGFYPQVIEDALDKLTILLQQLGVVGLLQYLRVPEVAGVPALPVAAVRANTVQAYDSSGNPTVLVPASGSAADVLIQLADITSAAKNAALMLYSASLTYADGTSGAHMAMVRSAKDYPYLAPTNGSSANAALTAFFTAASNGVNFLPAGTYTLTSLLDLSAVPLSNCVIKGVPGLTKITGNFDFRTILLGALNHVVFEDIIFENTYTSAAVNNTYAAVYTVNNDIKEVSFRRCKFTSPNCDGNGLYHYSRTNPAGSETCVIDGLWVTDCEFTSLGQVGFGINNNQVSADKYTAVRRVHIRRNKFDVMGIKLRYGMAVTLNGFLSAFSVDDNYVNSPYGVGIENTFGIDGSMKDNRFLFDPAKKSRAMSVADASATYPSRGMTISGNKCLNDASYHSYASFCNDSTLSGNTWRFTGAVTGEEDAFWVLDSNRIKITGDFFISDKKYAMRFVSTTGTCSGNRLRNCTFDTSASAAVTATVNFDGASTTDNYAEGKMTKGTGGSAWTQTNSAANNAYGYDQSGAWTPDITFATPGDLAKTLTVTGNYNRVGRVCTLTFQIDSTAFTWTTAASFLRITGMPFAAANIGQLDYAALGTFRGITKAGFSQFALRTVQNQTYMQVTASNSAAVPSGVVAADMPSGGTLALYGTISYQVQD